MNDAMLDSPGAVASFASMAKLETMTAPSATSRTASATPRVEGAIFVDLPDGCHVPQSNPPDISTGEEIVTFSGYVPSQTWIRFGNLLSAAPIVLTGSAIVPSRESSPAGDT
ncbi:hypothetical protein [Pendulispora albinea]|uniref:Uncharacterized protein n=1 Tax=Pendulispora albinea TaxID=2741071 RepID=A0ABZ2LMN9_9BACT